ncbi:lutropin subunit beta [Rhynchocyon petersi]
METVQGLLVCLVLVLGSVWASQEPLQPMCRPVLATLAAEKEGCPVCVTYNTTICAGYCPTMVRLLLGAIPLPQHVCTHGEMTYSTLQLPDCLPGVDPTFRYPVAVSCNCGLCNRRTTDCGGPKNYPMSCNEPPLPDLELTTTATALPSQ